MAVEMEELICAYCGFPIVDEDAVERENVVWSGERQRYERVEETLHESCAAEAEEDQELDVMSDDDEPDFREEEEE